MRPNSRSKIRFNKQIILRLIVIFLISQILFCASVKRYAINRGNDLTDIVNVGVEKDVYGFNFTILRPFIGYSYSAKGTGFGIRHGHIGFYKTGDSENKVVFKDKTGKFLSEHYMGNNFLDFAVYHEPINPRNERAKKKKYMVINSSNSRCSEKDPDFVYYKNRKAICEWWEGGGFYPVELSFGLYFGIRIGFNWDELVEFPLGIVGIDVYADDYDLNGNLSKKIGWIEKGTVTIVSIDEKDLPKASEKKDWESKLDAIDEKMNKRLTK